MVCFKSKGFGRLQGVPFKSEEECVHVSQSATCSFQNTSKYFWISLLSFYVVGPTLSRKMYRNCMDCIRFDEDDIKLFKERVVKRKAVGIYLYTTAQNEFDQWVKDVITNGKMFPFPDSLRATHKRVLD